MDPPQQQGDTTSSSLFRKSLRPLLYGMKLSGLYFDNVTSFSCFTSNFWCCTGREYAGGRIGPESDQRQHSAGRQRSRHNVSIYSLVVLAILVVNVARSCTMFVPCVDSLNEQLISRLSIFSWMTLCTVQHFILSVSAHRGLVQRTLTAINRASSSLTALCRHVVVMVTLCWLLVAVNIVFFSYILFSDNFKWTGFMVEPFLTHIPISSGLPLTIVKISVLVIFSVLVVIWFMTTAFLYTLSHIFVHPRDLSANRKRCGRSYLSGARRLIIRRCHNIFVQQFNSITCLYAF